MNDLTCREVADSAPGFALDILEPAARAQVAAHLIRCPGCRETVSGMQDSAARLLDLGDPWSEAEWPGGAEWSELPGGPDWSDWPEWPADTDLPEVRPARRRLRVAVTMAAAALLLVGTTLGPEFEQAATTPAKPVATAALIAGGQPVGTVRIYAHPTPAIDVQVSGLSASGTLTVVLVTADGRVHRLGRLQLARGRGAWIGPEPVSAAQVNGVALVDPSGADVASAGVL